MNIVVTRRQAIRSALAASAVIATGRVFGQAPAAAAGPHKLPPLGYAYDALEPSFDAKTMEIHHTKHHQAYVTKLNEALAGYPDLQKLSVEELLTGLDKVPEAIRTAVRNHGGGHYNHSLFWKSLKKNEGTAPGDDFGGALLQALDATNAEEAKEKFTKKALSLFGSGWIWISIDKDKKLKLETMPNQDNPLMFGRKALVGLDLWEHAYYLKYQNRRVDYVQAFNDVINWEFVEKRYNELTA